MNTRIDILQYPDANDPVSALGDIAGSDCALEWLERAIEYGHPGLSRLAITPWFDRIRDDRRWPPLLERVGRAPDQLDAIEFHVKLLQRR